MLDVLPPPPPVQSRPAPRAPIALVFAGYAGVNTPSGLNTPIVAVREQRARFGERAMSVVKNGHKGKPSGASSVYKGNGQHMHPFTLLSRDEGDRDREEDETGKEDASATDGQVSVEPARLGRAQKYDAECAFRDFVDEKKTLNDGSKRSEIDIAMLRRRANCAGLVSAHTAFKQGRKKLAQRKSNGVAEKEGESAVQEATETPNPLADVERMAEEEADFITTLNMIAEFCYKINALLRKSVSDSARIKCKDTRPKAVPEAGESDTLVDIVEADEIPEWVLKQGDYASLLAAYENDYRRWIEKNIPKRTQTGSVQPGSSITRHIIEDMITKYGAK